MKSFLFDERCGSSHAYKVIKNCIGPQDKFSTDPSCKLCNQGADTCHPSFKGGYCLKNGKKTDAYGKELINPGRDLSGLSEEEVRDYDEAKYQEIKNECNPFYAAPDDDYEDDEDDDDDDDEDDEDDRIDKRYRRSRRGSHRRSHDRGGEEGRGQGNRRERSLKRELKEQREQTHYYQSLDDKIKYGIGFVCLVLLLVVVYPKDKIKDYYQKNIKPFIDDKLSKIGIKKSKDTGPAKPVTGPSKPVTGPASGSSTEK